MRLIDKDVLLKKLGNNSWDIDEWDLPSKQITGGLMANAMDRKTVEEMPTVDAVPIDWLICKRNEHNNDGFAWIFEAVMEVWRREHETD